MDTVQLAAAVVDAIAKKKNELIDIDREKQKRIKEENDAYDAWEKERDEKKKKKLAQIKKLEEDQLEQAKIEKHVVDKINTLSSQNDNQGAGAARYELGIILDQRKAMEKLQCELEAETGTLNERLQIIFPLSYPELNRYSGIIFKDMFNISP